MFLQTAYKLRPPKEPLDDSCYQGDSWEKRLWAKSIKIPKKLQAGRSYRIREDYYNVAESHYDEQVTIKNLRLVGTDVILSAVTDGGKFGIVIDRVTHATYKLYYKFFRLRQPTETFNPNLWVWVSDRPKQYVTRIFSDMTGEPRIKLYNYKSIDGYTAVVTIFEGIKNRYDVATRQLRIYHADLEELLWECLLRIQEHWGYWNYQERQLYDAIANKKLWENSFVLKYLNSDIDSKKQVDIS